jgi:chromosomal replication initiator protein
VRSHDQLDQAWAEVQLNLRRTIPDDVFRMWLEPLRPVAIRDGTLYLEASPRTRDWVKRRFGAAFMRAAAEASGPCRDVELTGSAGLPLDPAAAAADPVQLKPAYSFGEFVIGSSNRFAHAAALAVAELPGQAYNPLFLYGPPGVGKTHLLQAVGNYILLNDRGLAIRYAAVETFTSEFTNALRLNQVHDFKRAYREVDVLLLDDVQFLEHKQKTSEELFYTFDALLGAGAQIVLTADRAASVMPQLESRLRERFEAGLVVDLHPPDFHTRLSILQKRAGQVGTDKDQSDALTYLARRVPMSVRALEGALIRARAYASLTQQALTTDLIERVLATLQTSDAGQELTPPPSTVERIQTAISSALSLPVSDLNSSKRSRQVVYARQLAMYLCRELTPLSLPAIGQRFGGRDHTTVLHAHRQVRGKMFSDQSTRELVERLVEELRPVIIPPSTHS